jgi:hypothetical protein
MNATAKGLANVFPGGSAMSAAMRSFDWSATPLGHEKCQTGRGGAGIVRSCRSCELQGAATADHFMGPEIEERDTAAGNTYIGSRRGLPHRVTGPR